MAEIRLTLRDGELIQATLDYLDIGSNELLESVRPSLTDADWEFVTTYIHQRVRSALQIEMMARAMARASIDLNLCDDAGADHFLRSKSWLHNYGVTQTADEYFTALSIRYEDRLNRALDAMVMIAQDRMFGSFDEEYERLLNPQ